MPQDSDSYIDMFRKFGSDLGIPKFDMDKVIESHRKNLEALAESAKIAAGGAQSVAEKQREAFEAALKEASSLAQNFQLKDPSANLTTQTEFAKKVFEIAMQGAKETAQTSRQSTADAFKVIQDRMRESLNEFRGSLSKDT